MFQTRGAELHRRHLEQKLDCGSCHLDANLQDDRELMPPYDDARRARLNRSGTNECAHCHGTTPVATTVEVHAHHAGQWCYNCHEGTDLRPLGQAPPVTTPRESCILCHVGTSYTAVFPFAVHDSHAAQLKCYTCHQGTPRIEDWPARWSRTPGVLATYGAGCAGPGTPPVLGVTGSAALGRQFQVTLSGAPALAPAILVLGFQGEAMDMEGYGMPRCLLLVDYLTSWVAITGSAGTATFVQGVPPVQDLVGFALYFQWFVPDANANQAGIATSNGGRATVGF